MNRKESGIRRDSYFSYVKMGFWNVNGWSSNNESDNSIFRESCIHILDLDIIGVAETHIVHD